MRKGVFFSLDTVFAVTIAVTMVVAITFFLDRLQKDPVTDLYIEKAANQILLSLVNNRTFENPNSTFVANAFTAVLPPNLGGNLQVDLYTCRNPSCTLFNRTGGYSVDKCKINVVDVVLVMDRSGSMQGKKLSDAKAAAATFVDQLDSFNDRSGLVSFSSSSRLDRNLTFDKNSVKSGINSLVANGNTAIGSGIETASSHLSDVGRKTTKWAEVLLSDGQNNRGVNPIVAANDARTRGIVIYAIGLGSDSDNATMSQIANVTGGKYYYAPTSDDLDGIYQKIASELLAKEFEISLARTSFLTFTNTTIKEFGTAELRLCVI